MATAIHVRDVRADDFQSSVIDESFHRPVAVDFWASWCAPCRVLGPILEKLASEFQGDFLLAKVNTETETQLAARYQIRSIPVVKIFKNGEVVDELLGAVPESDAREFLRRSCPSEAERRFEKGMECLKNELPDKAKRLFEESLELDPSHAGALVELGKISATSGDTEAASALWNRVRPSSSLWNQAQNLKQMFEFEIVCSEGGGTDICAQRATSKPENLEARFANGCCCMGAGAYRDALEEFLFVLSRDKGFRDQAARRAMLTIFSLVGERSDLAEEYRKRLAQVLF